MKILERILGIFALSGLVLIIVGLFVSKRSISEFIRIDNNANLAVLEKFDKEELTDNFNKQYGLLIVLEDDYHDVTYVNILGNFLTVIDTEYYDYVNILGFEIYNEEYVRKMC